MDDGDEVERRLRVEMLRVEIGNKGAETERIFAEIRRMERERTLYPIVVGSGFLLALLGIVKALG